MVEASSPPVPCSEPSAQKKLWLGQYSEEILKYGFIKYDKDKQEPGPQCVICNEVLANETKEKVPYTYGEKLILPATLDTVTTVLDEKSAEKIKCVPVNDTTVSRRVGDIAEDLEFQLVSCLQAVEEYAIQLDESTDIANCTTLLVYVRSPWEDDFLENILCCLTLPTHTTASQIFRVLNDCVTGK
ncbi:protein FAM200B-like [Macrobrachium rosenbergii]|uniref:protein FAM200B-like n=1 Tax=Macrobrachium rosenbergii TaxID=79674 RepID=UPI0034D5565B